MLIHLLFSFRGRITRGRFWLYFLPWLVGLMGIYAEGMREQVSAIDAVAMLYGLLTMYSSFAVCVKRIHDLNGSGWKSLLLLIPLFSLVFWIYLGSKRGTQGENRFGPDPTSNSERTAEV
jgi:uncharacterized membrane protein YhaH (DUF805 family)